MWNMCPHSPNDPQRPLPYGEKDGYCGSGHCLTILRVERHCQRHNERNVAECWMDEECRLLWLLERHTMRYRGSSYGFDARIPWCTCYPGPLLVLACWVAGTFDHGRRKYPRRARCAFLSECILYLLAFRPSQHHVAINRTHRPIA